MAIKLEAAEAKLLDLRSNLATLRKKVVDAMAAVEAQQQRLTLQRLIPMVICLSPLTFSSNWMEDNYQKIVVLKEN